MIRVAAVGTVALACAVFAAHFVVTNAGEHDSVAHAGQVAAAPVAETEAVHPTGPARGGSDQYVVNTGTMTFDFDLTDIFLQCLCTSLIFASMHSGKQK